jgi:hypothetical protein
MSKDKDIMVVPEPVYVPTPELVPFPAIIPWWEPPRKPPQEPCMFDGLPPGVYGLVCHCPRCTPRCM